MTDPASKLTIADTPRASHYPEPSADDTPSRGPADSPLASLMGLRPNIRVTLRRLGEPDPVSARREADVEGGARFEVCACWRGDELRAGDGFAFERGDLVDGFGVAVPSHHHEDEHDRDEPRGGFAEG